MQKSKAYSAAVLGAVFMAFLGVAVNTFTTTIDWRVIVCGRAVFSVIVMGGALAIFRPISTRSERDSSRSVAILLRAFFGTVGMGCMFYSYHRLNVEDAAVLLNLYPLWVFLMRLRSQRRWATSRELMAFAFAILGVIMVVNPTYEWRADGFSVAIAGSVSIAIAMVSLSNSTGKSPLYVVFVFSGVAMFCFLPTLGYLARHEFMQALIDVRGLLIGSVVCAILASMAQLFLTYAFQNGESHLIGALGLLQVPFAAIFAAVQSDAGPSVSEVIGIACVFLGCAQLFASVNRSPDQLRSDKLAIP